jgi:peptidoglycan/LPS O-acetylase OafA/YrhL
MANLRDLSVGRENSITFLRLIAAMAVIYSHSYAIVPSGGRD